MTSELDLRYWVFIREVSLSQNVHILARLKGVFIRCEKFIR